jgi:hypothetical protein
MNENESALAKKAREVQSAQIWAAWSVFLLGMAIYGGITLIAYVSRTKSGSQAGLFNPLGVICILTVSMLLVYAIGNMAVYVRAQFDHRDARSALKAAKTAEASASNQGG